ncbi:hypothetical protein G9464_12580 [Halostella sp. JP-L12]|uniref:HalOD1 output domain-containing protein n=1 Tax=Halostella TaxID=1843185 RepID=UPI000EF8543A|nr:MULTISPECIES: HalOD1 output domain-containing protein [Halostella]NHN48423.1 hypothetical protein [Halostella sp. JP-L12]
MNDLITKRTADADPVSQTVLFAVAEAIGDDPLELPPLYDAIDPDALNKLFDSSAFGAERGDGTVEFAYAGCDVSVRADGRVTVVPGAESTAAASPAVTSD